MEGLGIKMNDEIRVLTEKVDFLTKEILLLTSKLKSIDDMKEDVSLFTKDAFNELVEFMSEVDFHFRSKDLLSMIKKLLRNINNISKMVDQLQSVNEFLDDLRPLSKEIFGDVTDKIYALEQKGILASLKQTVITAGELSENISPVDVENFGKAIALMIRIAKKLSNRGNIERLTGIYDEIESYEKDKNKKVSLFKIFKKAKDPMVLKSLDYALDMAKIVSKHYIEKK